MARKSARPGRTVTVFFVGAGRGLRPGGPDRDLEAGPRPRPRGRHPDHADRQGRPEREQGQPQRGGQHHRQPCQRLRCHRGDGQHPGQQRDRGPGARPHQEQPGRDRRTPGAAAVPPGRPGAPEHRHHDAAAVLDLARRRRDRCRRPPAPRSPSPRRSPPARTGRRPCSARTRTPRRTSSRARSPRRPTSTPSPTPTTGRRQRPDLHQRGRTTRRRTRRPTRTRSPG